MAEINTALVKKLRERTGEGMMDCKKALLKAGGEIEKAIDDMRASGAIKAAKKAGNIAIEGAIALKEDGKSAVLLEVNSQTDFLAIQDDFKAFVLASIEQAFADKLITTELLIKAQEAARIVLVGKVGENVNIRRLVRIEGDVVGGYLHGNTIGAVVALKGGDVKLAKDIAMHVAATHPEFLLPSEVSNAVIQREQAVFLRLNADKIAGKPENIVDNMINGRIRKFLAEVSLVEQAFIKNHAVKVGELVKKAGAEIVSFTYYKVGEDIEKPGDNFFN
ncbi:translation elongation factor Ts [Candidatus Pseudomonas adelgestsugas]|uniref:Elongation factor Ts n=1 Tax=Candidatus Pseudomonas adelgestsugas TaxID=1302376 RepID=A0ABX5R8W9_9PSED|nr:translation elongation factor Ts [Candidatus Pseudomonas adelgestsugas]QAX82089.1 Elongation factor Ts [Candidatus Pseudomonas adelgestsugas]